MSETYLKLVQSPPGEIWIGSIFRVRLSNVRVVAGALQLPDDLTIEMIASDSGVITSSSAIFVVLQGQGNEIHVVE